MNKSSVANPERDAQELLDTVWAKDGSHHVPLPVDPLKIATRLGIQVFVAGLDRKISGMLAKRPGEDPQIYLNGVDSDNRKRFTCAHELGHYVNHIAAGEESWENIDYRSPLSSEGTEADEIYANRFAASLLMPRSELRRLVGQHSRTILAYEFGVSEDALNYRLSKLKLT
jgi:Zn-dependent peptidase ImmA (M78 family)